MDDDFTVFRLRSHIFPPGFSPLPFVIHNPRFKQGLDRLCETARASEDARTAGGVLGKPRSRVSSTAAAALDFACFYLLPSKANPRASRHPAGPGLVRNLG